jgi:hypothetical protein
MAYAVARRTLEIGVRVAVGATRLNVRLLVAALGLRAGANGAGIGADTVLCCQSHAAFETVRNVRSLLGGGAGYGDSHFAPKCIDCELYLGTSRSERGTGNCSAHGPTEQIGVSCSSYCNPDRAVAYLHPSSLVEGVGWPLPSVRSIILSTELGGAKSSVVPLGQRILMVCRCVSAPSPMWRRRSFEEL